MMLQYYYCIPYSKFFQYAGMEYKQGRCSVQKVHRAAALE